MEVTKVVDSIIAKVCDSDTDSEEETEQEAGRRHAGYWECELCGYENDESGDEFMNCNICEESVCEDCSANGACHDCNEFAIAIHAKKVYLEMVFPGAAEMLSWQRNALLAANKNDSECGRCGQIFHNGAPIDRGMGCQRCIPDSTEVDSDDEEQKTGMRG
jgi:hypothetical protein